MATKKNEQMGGKEAVTILAVVGGAAILLFSIFRNSPEQDAKEIAAVQAKYAAESAAHQKRLDEAEFLKKAHQSRDDFDNATRKDTADRQKKLEANSVKHTMTNKHGVRIDRYFLKNGQTVTCTTKVPTSGPALFECDGEP